MTQPTKTAPPRDTNRHREKGQMTIFMVLVLVLFLVAFMGFGVDMTNLFFSRQKAQGAADAACQACAMDLLNSAQGTPTPAPGFTVGTAFNCAGTPGATPCEYAALNGYSGTGLVANTASNAVDVTFPGSVPDVTLPPSALAPVPLVQVTVTDRVKTYFTSLLTGSSTQDTGASAVCGLQLATAPVPIIVLNPTCTHSFEVSGSATVKIIGGPTKSIQVNSRNQTCAAATAPAQCTSNGRIDLSHGGPGFTGSIFGVFGAPTTVPPNFMPGSTGRWQSPSSPISDPFALTPAPTRPGSVVTNPTGVAVPWVGANPGASHGCPDHSGCRFYTRGLYDRSILVKGETAIFEPGVYYIEPTDYPNPARSNCGSPGNGCIPNVSGQCAYDFLVESNGVVRMSTDAGDGSGGVMFYLSGPGSGARPYGSVGIQGNGGNSGGRTVDSYATTGMNCDGSSPDPLLGVPATVDGNVLVGQCTSGGSYRPYQTAGNIRGILFFNDRRNGYDHGQASMQGSGAMLLSGTEYFHHCNSTSGVATAGTACQAPPNGYQGFYQLQGNPGGGTYLLGNITTDQFVLSGNGDVAMQLNPNAVYQILKVTMVK
jgi:hypothetical protein